MSEAETLPTRRDEAWRYSDTDTAAKLWPVEVERIEVQRTGIVAPNDTKVGHIEMVIPFTMQAEFGIVEGPGYHHTCQLIVVAWFN